jgi:hypothetical protein
MRDLGPEVRYAGQHGVDPAITGELPEEQASSTKALLDPDG